MTEAREAHAAAVKLERVVIGVDFSAPSLEAVAWARDHFAPDAETLVVHALDVPHLPRFMRGDTAFPARDDVLKSARTGATSRLEELRRQQGWGAVGLHVREGRPEDAVAGAAAETQADIIIVGEHAHPRGVWNMPGSTAEALVRTASVPVLLARSPGEGAPRRILVAVDDSDNARLALAWADMLAARSGVSLTVLHVFRSVYLGIAKIVSGMDASARLEEDQLDQTSAWLDQFVREGVRDPAPADTRLERGDPVSAVVAAQRGPQDDGAVAPLTVAEAVVAQDLVAVGEAGEEDRAGAAVVHRRVHELLEADDAVDHWKAKGFDFSNILYQPDLGPEVGRFCQMPQDHGLDKSLDVTTLLDLCRPAIESGEKVEAELPIRNVNRVVGTITGSEITKRWGPKGLPDDTVRIRFRGSAGQSFAGFMPRGMTFVLEGDDRVTEQVIGFW